MLCQKLGGSKALPPPAQACDSPAIGYRIIKWQVMMIIAKTSAHYQYWYNYSRVHISSDEVFSKILKKPSIVQKKMMPHIKAFPPVDLHWFFEISSVTGNFLDGHFEFFFFKKKKKNLLHLIKKTKGFHMRYHFFLYYGWFLQNLRKDFIQTNMHTTVHHWQPWLP